MEEVIPRFRARARMARSGCAIVRRVGADMAWHHIAGAGRGYRSNRSRYAAAKTQEEVVLWKSK